MSNQLQDKNKQTAIQSSRERIINNARVVSFFTFLSRILGAVRDLVMLHIFGAGAIYDAFIIALTIPNVLRRLTAEGSLSMVFVPLYIEIKEKRSPEDAKVFAHRKLPACLLLSVLFYAQLVLVLVTVLLIYLPAALTKAARNLH